MPVSLRSRISLVSKLLKNKLYRDAYVSEHIKNGIPFQIRAMRDERDWTQARLGKEAGKPQNVISRLEDPNYGKLTIQTLLEIAAAFNVALLVKFVPFSRLVKEYEDVSPKGLSVKSIDKEIGELEQWAEQDTEPIEDAAAVASVLTLVDHDTFESRNVNRLIATKPHRVQGQLEFGFKSIHGLPRLQSGMAQEASITTTRQLQPASLMMAESTNKRTA